MEAIYMHKNIYWMCVLATTVGHLKPSFLGNIRLKFRFFINGLIGLLYVFCNFDIKKANTKSMYLTINMHIF